MKKKILVVAGEASGDLHGAGLLKELKKINPDLDFFGMGGDKMKNEGLKILYHINQVSFMGLFEILSHLGFLRKVFRNTVKQIDSNRPDLAILIDYSGFNLRLAKKLKQKNIPIVYYISPQVWAWRKNRVQKIKKFVDKMVVFFPFELDFYQKEGVKVELVGHPLVNLANPILQKEEFLKKIQTERDQTIIGLLPGSREQEIKKILPVMLEACQGLKRKIKDMKVIIGLAPTINKELVLSQVNQNSDVKVLENLTYDVMKYSDLLLVTSGTATVESALMETPMLVIYKTNFMTYFLAKLLVKVPYISMVNLIAQKQVVPEFIQSQANPFLIAQEMEKILQDKVKYQQTKQELSQIKIKLSSNNTRDGDSPYLRAAKIVNQILVA
ncbi:MAG TPA: lipid-A-disaccharide synthase [candidate division Zixibacteria bacterium]|nr:lipid-A-disaccharide synthase [candidate division Zixibacteria bacterium]